MAGEKKKKIVKVLVSVKASSTREARWLVLRALAHDRFWKRLQARVRVMGA